MSCDYGSPKNPMMEASPKRPCASASWNNLPPVKLELEQIRNTARNTWLNKQTGETSYQGHFYKKPFGDQPTWKKFIPEYRNNPQPSAAFMVTRMHQTPGFHNANTAIVLDPYQVDDSTDEYEQNYRQEFKTKFEPRPKTAALRPYKHDLLGVNDRALQALAIVKNDSKISLVPEPLPYAYVARSTDPFAARQCREPTGSLHRYLKYSGNRELEDLRWATVKKQPNTVEDYRQQDLETMKRTKVEVLNPTRRGDFCIHPDYPPKLHHHRLNGLSSVDMPYSPPIGNNVIH